MGRKHPVADAVANPRNGASRFDLAMAGLIVWGLMALVLPVAAYERWRRSRERGTPAGAAKERALRDLQRKVRSTLRHMEREGLRDSGRGVRDTENSGKDRPLDSPCTKCGGPTVAGFATALGLVGGAVTAKDVPRLAFVVTGTPTQANPASALQQGPSGETPAHAYLIRGRRCTRCGLVELYASDRTTL